MNNIIPFRAKHQKAFIFNVRTQSKCHGAKYLSIYADSYSEMIKSITDQNVTIISSTRMKS